MSEFSTGRWPDEGNTNILLIYWTIVHITLVVAISKCGKNNKWTASI